ncbi:MAG: hypothetical protein M0Z66_16925 [Thermaerobacter sp.]|nr:hypothetical protein [Thermaerobacter sp.]
MRARKAGLLGLLIACGLLLSGCWDMHDISDRTPIIAMGFDYRTDGTWRAIISDALLAQGGSASYSGNIHYGEGPTLTEAIEDLRTHLARRFYLGSTKIYVLGMGVLQNHSTEVLRMLLQRSEVDQTGFVLCTRGTAQDLLSHPDGAMGLTGVRLLKEFESEPESRDGHIKEPIWKTVWGALDTSDTLRIPIFDNLPQTSVKASGTALITNGQMKTMLDREESVTLRWLLNMYGRNVLPLDPPYEGYELKTSSVRTTTRYDGKTRHISIQSTADMEVYTAPSMKLPAALIQTLSQAAAETMVRRIMALTQKMQSADTDGALWHNTATQAGYFDFDLKKTSVSVTVKVRTAPHFAPSV